MKINLDKLFQLASDPINDLYLFGPQLYTDHETETTIEREGYDYEKNTELILYISNADKVFMNLFNCVNDLFFVEELLSPDYIPSFHEQKKFSQYLKINYQHW